MPRPQKDFWDFVIPLGTDECWEWQGRRDKDGYGKYRFKLKEYRAHRWSYALANGGIDQKLLVRHTCDNPPCVNPKHLLQGTVKQNAQDMIERGRANYVGSYTHPPRKLSEEKMRLILEMRATGATQKEIAEALDLSQPYVGKLLRRQADAQLSTRSG